MKIREIITDLKNNFGKDKRKEIITNIQEENEAGEYYYFRVN